MDLLQIPQDLLYEIFDYFKENKFVGLCKFLRIPINLTRFTIKYDSLPYIYLTNAEREQFGGVTGPQGDIGPIGTCGHCYTNDGPTGYAGNTGENNFYVTGSPSGSTKYKKRNSRIKICELNKK